MGTLRSNIQRGSEPKILAFSSADGVEGYRLDLGQKQKARAQQPAAQVANARNDGDLDFNPATGALFVLRVPTAKLTARQGRLLLALMDQGGAEVSKQDLLRAVWGDEAEKLGASTLPSLVMAVRANLGETPGRPAYLHRGPGHGYLLTQTKR